MRRRGLLAARRYGGAVCKPNYHIVEAGFIPADPLMIIKNVRMSHRDTQGDGSGLYVREDDSVYLKDKWRPDGAHNLIAMDVSTDQMRPRVVGENDKDWFGSWTDSIGTWIGARTAVFRYKYVDRYDDHVREREQVAEFSEDGTMITWVNGTSQLNGSQQLCVPPAVPMSTLSLSTTTTECANTLISTMA